MTPKEKAVHDSRQSVYGDFVSNMTGTSEQIQGLHRNWQSNNPDASLPAWWTPLVQVAVKLNRIASGHYHEDNFVDGRNYLAFVEAMQRPPATPAPPAPRIERVYVAAPYTAPTREQIVANVARAVQATAEVMRRGHDAHCPHSATDPVAQAEPLDYERWMRLDFGIIEKWATAILVVDDSPGVRRELELAKRLGLKVYLSVEDVPKLGG